MGQFINPNWHVIFIHYPLGLLTVGVLIELLSFLWRHSTARTAGRWMILIGALSCIPAATMGLYAFRDVVSPDPLNTSFKWLEVVHTSQWSDEQWHYMQRHALLAGVGTGLAVLGSFVWLSASDRGRRTLYLPMLGVVLAGLVVLNAAAWYSGESVYRHGTAVAAERSGVHGPATAPALTTTAPALATRDATGTWDTERPHTAPDGYGPRSIDYYIPRLQLHLLFAGLTVAFALGALGTTIRRWTLDSELRRYPAPAPRPVVPDTADEAARREALARPTATYPATAVPAVFPARVWLGAAFLAILTALAGLWSTGDWELKVLLEPIHNRFALEPTQRIFGHAAGGVTILVLLIVLGLLTRVAPRHRFLTVFFALLLLAVVGIQIWLGILMLFDSAKGPVTGFGA